MIKKIVRKLIDNKQNDAVKEAEKEIIKEFKSIFIELLIIVSIVLAVIVLAPLIFEIEIAKKIASVTILLSTAYSLVEIFKSRELILYFIKSGFSISKTVYKKISEKVDTEVKMRLKNENFFTRSFFKLFGEEKLFQHKITNKAYNNKAFFILTSLFFLTIIFLTYFILRNYLANVYHGIGLLDLTLYIFQ